jgi:hypothetical protein
MRSAHLHPRGLNSTHYMTKVMELVEDSRPCIHIFVNNFPLAVLISIMVMGTLGIFIPAKH